MTVLAIYNACVFLNDENSKTPLLISFFFYVVAVVGVCFFFFLISILFSALYRLTNRHGGKTIE